MAQSVLLKDSPVCVLVEPGRKRSVGCQADSAAWQAGRTATGKVVRNWGHKRHRLISKAKQQKRLHRGTTTLGKGDAKLVLTYMPYLRG